MATNEVSLIEDAEELSAAEEALRQAFETGADYSGSKAVGFQGGQADDLVLHWHSPAGIWGCIDGFPDPTATRFWNAFGTADPRETKGLSIVCEVNPPREGVNPRVAGAFGRDAATGHRLLLHRGRIGGGRAGIGQELFWSNTVLSSVSDPERLNQRFVVVADIDSPNVPAQVSVFVNEVQRIKALAGADATGEDEDPLEPTASSPSSRYAPLTAWLTEQIEPTVATTFKHIEALVGALPESARKYHVYWSGTAAGSPTHTQKRAWEAGGYTVSEHDLDAETVTFTRLGDSVVAVATAPRYWWVNQGHTYDREMSGGYVWAPVRARNGLELAHHRAVSELRVGDLVFHYKRGIRAVGSVTAAPEFAPNPDEVGEGVEREGRFARVEYTQLDVPISLDDIPLTWRIEEGGPFNSTGAVNQAYVFPLSPAFVRRLAGRFSEIGEMLGIEPGDDVSTNQGIPVTDLPAIASAIRAEGLRIDDRTLRRFHLATQARGFVILSGISGTGKTWLAEAYARAVRGELLLVPVAPNWNTNEDLLGYLNPIDGKYHDTTFSRFVRAAAAEWLAAGNEERPARPFFLVLDEMNLARVEYYFAQFLSALEVRSRAGSGTLHLGHEEVALGGNLKFIGTVNVDETTHGFADKVYDRAQLIELSAPRDALAAHIGAASHGGDLLGVWDVIHEVAPFAFRVVDEVDQYVRAAVALGVPWSDALDEQILQKVLPKVRGLDPAAGQALEAFLAFADLEHYPLSHGKAAEMLARFNQHGSVSFFG